MGLGRKMLQRGDAGTIMNLICRVASDLIPKSGQGIHLWDNLSHAYRS